MKIIQAMKMRQKIQVKNILRIQQVLETLDIIVITVTINME